MRPDLLNFKTKSYVDYYSLRSNKSEGGASIHSMLNLFSKVVKFLIHLQTVKLDKHTCILVHLYKVYFKLCEHNYF